jgi:hypothetical protein
MTECGDCASLAVFIPEGAPYADDHINNYLRNNKDIPR